MEIACANGKGIDVWVFFMIPGIGFELEPRLSQNSWTGLIGGDS